MKDLNSLGQRALARRKELKLTQREAAKLAGVAHVTISQWERDETQPVGTRLFSLAKPYHAHRLGCCLEMNSKILSLPMNYHPPLS